MRKVFEYMVVVLGQSENGEMRIGTHGVKVDGPMDNMERVFAVQNMIAKQHDVAQVNILNFQLLNIYEEEQPDVTE